MAEEALLDIDELINSNIPITSKQWTEYIKLEDVQALRRLAQQSNKRGSFPDPTIEPAKSQYRRFRIPIKKMDEFLQITPEIRKETSIDKNLRYLVIDEAGKFHFPDADVDAVTLLLAKWESENYGANEVKDEDHAEEEGIDEADDSEAVQEPAPKRRRISAVASSDDDSATGAREVLLPPVEHDIFGVKGGRKGIMYGIALKRGLRKTFGYNPALVRYKRSANAYGSNGLSVGAWFPYQIVALFRGAHGASQGGIHGNTENGAYSVVISGLYDGLDKDHGDTVFYSGSD